MARNLGNSSLPEPSLAEIQVHLQRNLPSYSTLLSAGSTGLQEKHVNLVRSQLQRHSVTRIWADRPRTFTILWYLAWIDQDFQLTEKTRPFLEDPAGDYLIPFNELLFPLPKARGWKDDWDQFSKIQPYLLSKLSLFDGPVPHVRGSHKHLDDLSVLLTEVDPLGARYRTQVHKVHDENYKYFVKKSIWRSETLFDQRAQYEEFDRERRAMQALDHKHMVKCLGTYTDRNKFSLLMTPVCDSDLEVVLTTAQANQHIDDAKHWLRQSFGCLAKALHYLHTVAGIRHRDIKPSNILVHKGSIYLCDFGIATLFSENGATTEGPVIACTRRYSAPEVIDEQPRNECADVWSLGCVYLEIITVIKGKSLEEMDRFLEDMEAKRDYWAFTDQVLSWMDRLVDRTQDDIPLEWIKSMIRPQANKRPSAEDIFRQIQACVDADTVNPFIGDCCSIMSSKASTESGRWTSPPSTGSRQSIQKRNEEPRPPRETSRYWENIQLNLDKTYERRVNDLHAEGEDRADNSKDRLHLAPSETDSSSGEAMTRQSSSQPRSHSNSMTTVLSSVDPTQYATRTRVHANFGPRPSTESELTVAATHTRDSSLLSTNTELKEVLVFERQIRSHDRLEGGEAFRQALSVNVEKRDIRLYQVHVERPDQCTRKLVIDIPAKDGPSIQLSTWLPLANIHIRRDVDRVFVKWSDCNHLKIESTGNYGKQCHREWDPAKPNNHVGFHFLNPNDAAEFVEAMRLLHDDSCISKHGDSIFPSPDKSIQIQHYDLGRHRLLLMTGQDDIISTYVYLAPLLLGFKTSERDGKSEFVIYDIKQPLYWSNVHKTPTPDQIGQWKKTKWPSSSLEIEDGMSRQNGLIKPSSQLKSLIENLTRWKVGWTLLAYGRNLAVKQRKAKGLHMWRELAKNDGELMIWNCDGPNGVVVKLSFRLPSDKPDKLEPYLTGKVPGPDPVVSSHGKTAIIKLDDIHRGRLLNVVEMKAQTEVKEGSSSVSGPSLECRIEFNHEEARLEFEKIIRRLSRQTRPEDPQDSRSLSGIMNPVSPTPGPPRIRIINS